MTILANSVLPWQDCEKWINKSKPLADIWMMLLQAALKKWKKSGESF